MSRLRLRFIILVHTYEVCQAVRHPDACQKPTRALHKFYRYSNRFFYWRHLECCCILTTRTTKLRIRSMERAAADRHRFLFHLQYIALPNILLAVFLATRLPRWVHYLFFAGFLRVSIAALHLQTGYAWMDYSMGSTVGGFALNAFHLLLLEDPIEQYRHKSDNPELGPKALSWWRRVYWSWSVILSSRGVGWNYQARTIPNTFCTCR